MKLFENIKERWITYRTGKTREEREWLAWYDMNVNWRANDITQMFEKFEHTIEVNPDRFFKFDPFTWVPCDDAKRYFWPARALGENCVWRIERVIWNQWEHRWNINEIGGEDRVFIGTNSEEDAVMLALKYV